MRRRGSSRPLDDHKQHQAGQRHHAHASGGQDGPSAGADAQHDDRQNGTGTGTQPRSRAKKILVVSTTIGSTEDLGKGNEGGIRAGRQCHRVAVTATG